LAEAKRVIDKYSLDEAAFVGDAEGVIESCWLVFVTGLLLEAFRTSADKVALRSAVIKWHKLLERPGQPISPNRLPAALVSRCSQALAFKVTVP
jgi:hypothetical protein